MWVRCTPMRLHNAWLLWHPDVTQLNSSLANKELPLTPFFQPWGDSKNNKAESWDSVIVYKLNTAQILIVPVPRSTSLDRWSRLAAVSDRNLDTGGMDLFWHMSLPASHGPDMYLQDYIGSDDRDTQMWPHLLPNGAEKKLPLLSPSQTWVDKTEPKNSALECSSEIIKPNLEKILLVTTPRLLPVDGDCEPASVPNGVLWLHLIIFTY